MSTSLYMVSGANRLGRQDDIPEKTAFGCGDII